VKNFFFSGKAKRKSGFWTFINVQFSFFGGGLGMKNISLVIENSLFLTMKEKSNRNWS